MKISFTLDSRRDELANDDPILILNDWVGVLRFLIEYIGAYGGAFTTLKQGGGGEDELELLTEVIGVHHIASDL